MKIRPFWIVIHRYAGLAMTIFLVIVGLTGSLLAFYTELEQAINPQFYVAAQGRTPLSPIEFIETMGRLFPQAQVEAVSTDTHVAQVSVSPRLNTATGKPYELDFDQILLNPYTGEELGRRTWGDISQGWMNLLPFIYKLHYSLALDELGGWILGITALVWTLDCFVGFYLTLPPSKSNRPFWQRWRPAWQIKWRASAIRLNFDLHRAGGLWLWLALLVFAWSSVYMNLGDTVYKAVMQSVSDFHEPWTEFADLDKPLKNPAITWHDAYRIGNEAMARAAEEQGFTVEKPVAMWLNRAKGFYVYSVRSSLDFQDHSGQTRVVIDATSGVQKMLLLPHGQYNGNTITSWLAALHMANVFGLPYRIFVCMLGLAIVMLAVTGVVIWLKKRQARIGRITRKVDSR